MKNFWKNRRILVTGSTGFIGSNLVEKLADLKSHVIPVSLGKSKQQNFLKVNVLDYEGLDTIIKKEKIDTIYHLAAESLVIDGQMNPYSTYKVNIIGTLNILEAAKKNKVRRVVIPSTSHVYGDNPDIPYIEEYFPRPTRPYETSKSCADLLAQSYSKSFNLSVVIARFSNTYGGGDMNFSRIVPFVVSNILQNKNIELYGGTSVRDYIYIKDVMEAYLKLGELGKYDGKNNIFNFGGDRPINVIDLARLILKISAKKNLEILITGDQREGEVSHQYVSSEKAKSVLNWKPKYTLEEGLKETFAWYKKNLKIK